MHETWPSWHGLHEGLCAHEHMHMGNVSSSSSPNIHSLPQQEHIAVHVCEDPEVIHLHGCLAAWLQLRAVELLKQADVVIYDDLGTQVCRGMLPPTKALSQHHAPSRWTCMGHALVLANSTVKLMTLRYMQQHPRLPMPACLIPCPLNSYLPPPRPAGCAVLCAAWR